MPDSSTTLAIILGVSECPRAPNLQPLPQCANSAADFDDYLRSSLGLPASNIINLFDSALPASDQLEQIEEWLNAALVGRQAPPADLILFYSGHGGFSRNDQSYFLAVRRTRESAEGASSIRYVDLASGIKRHAGQLRKYLILDCCFAAASVVKMQSDIGQMVIQRVEDELPPSGTAVLCSSAAKMVSIAPEGERHTMFGGALLRCLREGMVSDKEKLSLEDVGKQARRLINNKYPNQAVRPELHVPEQGDGDCAEVPLFPNASWTPSVEVDEELKRPPHQPTIKQSNLADRLGWIAGALSGIVSALSTKVLASPFGVPSEKDLDFYAPISPALIFLVALAVLNWRQPFVLWPRFIVIAVGACFIWGAAWCSVVWLNIAGHSLETFTSLSSFTAISYISGLLFRLLFVSQRLLKGDKEFSIRREAQACIPFALFGLLPAVCHTIFQTDLLTLPVMLAGYVSWQAYSLNSVSAPADLSETFLSKRQVSLTVALLSSLLIVNSPPIARSINAAVGTQVPVAVKTRDVTLADGAADGFKRVVVAFQLAKTTQDTLSCDISARANNSLVSADRTVFFAEQFDDETLEFDLPVSLLGGTATAHFICSGREKYEFDVSFELPTPP
jgi:hypothetical protein